VEENLGTVDVGHFPSGANRSLQTGHSMRSKSIRRIYLVDTPGGLKGKGGEKLPPEANHGPVEIITPDQPGLVDTPGGLHPNQYATRLLEEINFPIVPNNIRAVAAAIECEAKAMGVMSAYEFVLECTRYAIAEGCEITTFFFTDGKYRPERRSNSNGRQVSTQRLTVSVFGSAAQR
jgi:hypothetical protein